VDRGLVEAAQGGDHEAFEALAIGAADRLFAVARLILRDADLARDAVQEALVQAWRYLPGLRDPDRFDAWLHRLIVNACADVGRRQRRWTTELRLLTPQPSTDDGARVLADRDLIERGFRRLNADQRTVVVLRYYLDLTVPEIARTLAIAEGTVKSRLHHSMAALRSALEADGRTAVSSVERTA
jgi:RNA polymerase sigma-70 factor (ECF subfamily)